MFTTDRLFLRGLRLTDKENLLALFDDPAVAFRIDSTPVVPRGDSYIEETYAYFQKSLMFCIVEEQTPERQFVRFISFHQPPDAKNRRGMLGIGLLPKFWGKGYGKEMIRFVVDHGFEMLGLHKIELEVFDGNTRAIRLYQNIGFVEEARRRQSVWSEGGWHDVIGMGLLEDEWREKKRNEALTKT